jgi:hypothetical protein
MEAIQVVVPDMCVKKTEIFDANKLKWLRNIKFNQLDDEDKGRVKKYTKHSKNGRIEIYYKQAKSVKDEDNFSALSGRLYPENAIGYACLPRRIRNFIAHDLYDDVDMKNAHFTIFNQICNKAGLDTPKMTDFIENRDVYFEALKELDMDYDEAKLTFTSMLFGSITSKKNPFVNTDFEDIYNEINAERIKCVKSLTGHYPKEFATAQKRNKSNPYGSFISRLCCEVERNALLLMDKFLAMKGFQMDALIFDGGLVRRNAEKPLTQDILRETEEYVKTNLDFEIKLCIKPMVSEYTEEYEKYLNEKEQEDQYTKYKRVFEETHFKVINESCFYQIVKGSPPIIRNETKMKETYKHIKVQKWIIDKKTEEKTLCQVSFIMEWIDDPEMRIYQKTELLPPPLKCPADTFNLWEPFWIETIEDTEITDEDREQYEKIKNIMKHIVNYNEEFYNYLFKWFAFLFQKPAYKNNIAPCITSENGGVGKDWLLDVISHMLGKKYAVKISNVARDVFGNFNEDVMDKLLVVIDETNKKDTYPNNDKIKNLISAREICINVKCGIKLTNRRCFMKIIFISNQDFPVKVELGERRLVGERCKQERLNSVEMEKLSIIFGTLRPNAMKLLYQDFMNEDLEGFNWADERPITDFYKEAKVVSAEAEATFMIDYLKRLYCNDEKCEYTGRLVRERAITIPAKDLLMKFKSFMGDEYKTNEVKFGMKLKKMEMEGFEKRHTKNGIVYDIIGERAIKYFYKKGLLDENWYEMEQEKNREPIGECLLPVDEPEKVEEEKPKTIIIKRKVLRDKETGEIIKVFKNK